MLEERDSCWRERHLENVLRENSRKREREKDMENREKHLEKHMEGLRSDSWKRNKKGALGL